ncbi:MAG: 6,7-dimethyl-8-ribityllumazine synthase [Candidatus Azotimanducaceae bacterium]|jgi:6,7-dimethyl-8-ribityllumazine synthase
MQKIALIQSCWHKDIVDQFRISFQENIQTLESSDTQVDVFEAPGVVEIPLLSKLCAKKRKGEQAHYSAIVVAGLIVDHGVYRHEFVAQTVMDAIMNVQMEQEIPIIYGILTAQDFMTEGRKDFYFDHFAEKGREAANACSLTMANIESMR